VRASSVAPGSSDCLGAYDVDTAVALEMAAVPLERM